MQKLKNELDRNLSEKTKELFRVKKIRERHNLDIKHVNSRFMKKEH